MKKPLFLFFLMITMSVGMMNFAQGQNLRQGPGHGQSRMSFEQFMAGRISFLVKEMKLSTNDSVQFVSIYNEMMTEKGQLMRKYRGGRELMHKLFSGQNVPDSLYTNFVMNNAKLQLEDAQLEMKYLERLSKILTPRQLFDYQSGERKFRDNMMQRTHTKK